MQVPREIDIGAAMKSFIMSLFCLLLIVPTITVHAQQATPSPSATPGEITSSALLSAAVQIIVTLLGGGVILAIVNNWLKIADEKRTTLHDAEKLERQKDAADITNSIDLVKAINTLAGTTNNVLNEMIEYRRSRSEQDAVTVQALRDTAVAQGKMTVIMDGAETKQTAIDGRHDAVEAINKYIDDSQTAINLHTTEAIQSLSKDLASAQKAVETAAADIKKAVTAEQLQDALVPLTAVIERLGQRTGDILKDKADVQKLIDTGKLRAENARDRDPATD